jgi:hypothetical protein
LPIGDEIFLLEALLSGLEFVSPSREFFGADSSDKLWQALSRIQIGTGRQVCLTPLAAELRKKPALPSYDGSASLKDRVVVSLSW